ncbi:hypothetical protein [Geobacter anodireducens]|uniref:Bacterial repeat domain-containing protein n=2 Tax=Geobacter soli TaxID=1510391 RepID=A0A0C1QVK6_9BACT|nr:hypothetical protein [Geobacter soli]KIE42206.1 hypothetical protein SE37_06005 [Geobacter soli]
MMRIFRLLLAIALLLPISSALATTDGIYQLTESTSAAWDGTDANRLKTITSDYDFVYGDDEYLTYTLPWPSFTFYRQPYTQITVDTNGNIWFGAARSGRGFNLASAGFGPVIATWNDDLSSLYDGGVFIQHKTSPERVIVEWQTETYSDEGNGLLSSFTVTLYQDGKIRFGYGTFAAASATDAGSGISQDDGSHYLSVSTVIGSIPSLAGRYFYFNDVSQPLTFSLNIAFTGTGAGTITSTPTGIACNTNCSALFPAGEPITLTPQAAPYSLFSGWSNNNCTGTGNCLMTLDTDASITAAFTYDIAHQVRVDDGSSNYYPSIQSAYDAAAENGVIRLWATTYNESLSCSRPVTITLQGGYDSNYSTLIGEPVLNGALTVTDGTLILDGFSIR